MFAVGVLLKVGLLAPIIVVQVFPPSAEEIHCMPVPKPLVNPLNVRVTEFPGQMVSLFTLAIPAVGGELQFCAGLMVIK